MHVASTSITKLKHHFTFPMSGELYITKFSASLLSLKTHKNEPDKEWLHIS